MGGFLESLMDCDGKNAYGRAKEHLKDMVTDVLKGQELHELSYKMEKEKTKHRFAEKILEN